MGILTIVLGLALVTGIVLVTNYNRFQRLKTRINASVQEIGNQLKRQADLIPNLTASVKGYMKHEKKVFEDLTEARKQIVNAVDSQNPEKMLEAAQQAQQALGPIQAVFESTPELKAAGTVQKLMNELRDTADKVMYARRTLIDLTADYNALVVTFPSNLVANVFGFKKQPGLKLSANKDFLEVNSDDTQTPEVKL